MKQSFEQVKKVKIEFEDGSVSICTLFGKSDLIFKQLSDEIKELKSLMQWQPIETAPKDGTNIWIYSEYDGIGIGYYSKDFNCFRVWDFNYDYNESKNPTHWQPLPKLPTQ